MSRFNVFLIPPTGIYDDTVGAIGSWLGLTAVASPPRIRHSVVTVTAVAFGTLRDGLMLALESNNPDINFSDYDVQFDVITRNGLFAPCDEYMIETENTFRVTLVRKKKEKEIVSDEK